MIEGTSIAHAFTRIESYYGNTLSGYTQINSILHKSKVTGDFVPIVVLSK